MTILRFPSRLMAKWRNCFSIFKQKFETFSGEEKSVDGYLLRLLRQDAQKMENYVRITEFELK